MEQRQRLVVGAIWIAVAALIAVTVDPGAITWVDGLRVLVIVVALGLAGLYLFDPKGLVSRKFEF